MSPTTAASHDTRDASGFLRTFFTAQRRFPDGSTLLKYFDKAFVDPPRFQSYIDLVTIPNAGSRPKVVLIDGHPRTGKTWLAAGTVAAALRAIPDLRPDNWWTAGIDCRWAYDDATTEGPRDSLPRLAQKIAAELEARSKKADLRLVLLDDPLGTNTLRPLGDDPNLLLPYLRFDDPVNNPWLRHLPHNGVLVITGRSLFPFILGSLLGTDFWKSDPASGVYCLRWGVFRPAGNPEDTVGAFDKTTLAKVNKHTWQHHPFVTPDQPDEPVVDAKWVLETDLQPLVVQSSPLTAFSPDRAFNLEEKKAAAYMLFGEDLATLAETVVWISDPHRAKRWSPEAGVKLKQAYAVAVAPGVVFLGNGAYAALGLTVSLSRQFVHALYYTDDALAHGRLPNEFYKLALDEHLEPGRSQEKPGANKATLHYPNYTDVAIRTFRELLLPAGTERTAPADVTESTRLAIGLVLRGFIERARYTETELAWSHLNKSTEFQQLLNWKLRTKDGCLLLEFEAFGRLAQPKVGSAGLAAAISWALYKLFRDQAEQQSVEVDVKNWFLSQVNILIEGGSHPPEKPIDILSATYSSFLQWAIERAAGPEADTTLSDITRLNRYRRDVRPLLGVIVRDEFIWAVLEQGYDIEEYLGDHLRMLTSADHGSDGGIPEMGLEDRVNLYFTLAWHNGWMPGGPTNSHGTKRKLLSVPEWKEKWFKSAATWLEKNSEQAKQDLQSRPDLLDFNLQYHWRHFITQKALWMRDWSFQEDPLAYERDWRRIAEGSEDPRHQHHLRDIADILLSRVVPADKEGWLEYCRCIRGTLFLIATRADRMAQLPGNHPDTTAPASWFAEFLTKVEDQFPADPGSDTEREVLNQYILEAVFELHRQGYLDPIGPEKPQEGDKLLREWCRQRLTIPESLLQTAWWTYIGTLKEVTHELDLLPPHDDDGWWTVCKAVGARPIMPDQSQTAS